MIVHEEFVVEPIRIFEGHKKAVNAVAVVADTLYTGTSEGKIRAYNIHSGKLIRSIGSHSKDVTCMIAYRHDGDQETKIFTGSFDKTARAWTENGVTVQIYKKTGMGQILCLVCDFSKNRMYTGSSDNNIFQWDLSSASVLELLKGHTDDVRSLALHDGHLFSASNDGAVKQWNLLDNLCVRTFELSGSDVNRAFSVHAMGKALCIGTMRSVILNSTVTGKEVKTLEGHSGPIPVVTSASWTARSLFSGSADSSLRRWDLATGRCTMLFRGHTDWVRCATLYDDFLFSGSDDFTVRMWRITSPVDSESETSSRMNANVNGIRYPKTSTSFVGRHESISVSRPSLRGSFKGDNISEAHACENHESVIANLRQQIVILKAEKSQLEQALLEKNANLSQEALDALFTAKNCLRTLQHELLGTDNSDKKV